VAISKNSTIATSERKRIVALRKKYPFMGAYALANRISKGQSPFDGASGRPRFSTLSVIRRYDAANKAANEAAVLVPA
jgi:hypothetical protein